MAGPFDSIVDWGKKTVQSAERSVDWLEDRTGTSININRRDGPVVEFTGASESTQAAWDNFLRQIGLKKDKKTDETDSTGVDTLIGALEEQTKKAEREKADLASRALMNTQARLARDRKPGMDTKNKTILTSPLGVPTSLLTEPKKQTLLGA